MVAVCRAAYVAVTFGVKVSVMVEVGVHVAVAGVSENVRVGVMELDVVIVNEAVTGAVFVFVQVNVITAVPVKVIAGNCGVLVSVAVPPAVADVLIVAVTFITAVSRGVTGDNFFVQLINSMVNTKRNAITATKVKLRP
jgi:hypothetical protein